MPERISIAGEWMPPSDTMISRPRNSTSAPATFAFTPTARRPSNSNCVAAARLATVRLLRERTGGIEIADRRGRPLVRPVAHRHRAIAVAEVAVHVDDEGNLPFLRIAMHRVRQWRPIRDRRAPDRDRPVAAVQIAGEIEVRFELAKERQHAVPAPAGGAQRLPFVVVVGRSAQRHHAHHGGAAAHDARLRESDPGRVVAQPPMHLQLRPHIGVVVVGDRIGVAHVGGQIVRRRVLPGFEQQHAPVRRRGKTVGQHAAGRSATHDNGVVVLGDGIHCRERYTSPIIH